jgi:hypothetical protein
LGDQVKDTETGVACSTYGGEIGYILGFREKKLEKKRPLENLRLIWEDTIKIYLKETGGSRQDWSGSE